MLDVSECSVTVKSFQVSYTLVHSIFGLIYIPEYGRKIERTESIKSVSTRYQCAAINSYQIWMPFRLWNPAFSLYAVGRFDCKTVSLDW